MVLTLLEKLDRRFRLLESEQPDLSWKTWSALKQDSEGRDPGPSYHALMYTAGPATDNPTWTADWKSPEGYVFKAGTRAPRWSNEEILRAMMPQIRTWARWEARRSGGGHGFRQDPNALQDIEGNMMAELAKILDQEKDEGRILGKSGTDKGFVSYITVPVRSAGGKGVGGTVDWRNAHGRASNLAQGLVRTPEQARQIANKVSDQYKQKVKPSTPEKPWGGGINRKDPGNPFGSFSPDIYKLYTDYADALDAGDTVAVKKLQADAGKLLDHIEDTETVVQGTHTGKKIIGTPHWSEKPPEGVTPETATPAQKEKYGPYWDRELLKRTGVSSITGSKDDNEGQIDIVDTSHLKHLSDLDPETVYQVLSLGFNTPEQYLDKPPLAGKGLQKLTDYDLRYLIRQLANWLPGGKYPGKGKPGVDPELDANGKPSKWAAEGQPQLWDKEEILADIGHQSGSGGSTAVADLLNNLSGTQKTVMELIADAFAKTGKVVQKDIGPLVTPKPISKVMVGNHFTSALTKLGMTKEQFRDFVMSSGQSKKADVVDPITKFAGWMKQYQEETSEDELMDDINKEIVRRCARAIMELHYHLVLKPLILERAR